MGGGDEEGNCDPYRGDLQFTFLTANHVGLLQKISQISVYLTAVTEKQKISINKSVYSDPLSPRIGEKILYQKRKPIRLSRSPQRKSACIWDRFIVQQRIYIEKNPNLRRMTF